MHETEEHYDLHIRYTDKLTERVQLLHNDHESYIMKTKLNAEKAEREAQLLLFLQSRQSNVPVPLPTKDHSFVFTHDDTYYSVYSYIQGEPLIAVDYFQQPDKMQAVASSLAKLHDNLLDVPNSEAFPEKNIVRTLFGNVIPFMKSQGICSDVVALLTELEEDMRTLLLHLPIQVIHRDPHPDHFLFNDSQLSGILDLELAEQGMRLFDLCYFSTSLLNEVFSGPSRLDGWLKAVKFFFSSYHRKQKLSRDERRATWYMMLSIKAIFIAFFSHDPHLMEKNRSMFLWVYEQKDDIDRFLYLRG